MAEVPLNVLSFEDARRVVEQQAALVGSPGAESVDLLAAAGRVLAEAVLARWLRRTIRGLIDAAGNARSDRRN
jgi:molybdopterin biosynthesis enzyme